MHHQSSLSPAKRGAQDWGNGRHIILSSKECDCDFHKKMKAILAVLIIVVAFLQYRLWFADDGLIQSFRVKGEMRAQKAKNNEIIVNNNALVSEIDSLKKGGEAIENRARNDLGMVKKGEVFYQVVR